MLAHLGWFDFIERVALDLRSSLARAWVESWLESADEGDASSSAEADSPRPSHGRELSGDEGPTEPEIPFALASTAEAVAAKLDSLDGLEVLSTLESHERSRALERHAAVPGLLSSLSELEDLGPSFKAARRGGGLAPVELVGVEKLAAAAHALGHWLQIAVSDEAQNCVAAGVVGGDDAAAGRRGIEALGRELALSEGLVASACEGEINELGATLSRCIGFDPDTGEAIVADAASPALAQARTRLKGQKRSLARRAESMMRSTELRGLLQDEFWTEREGRVVLPIRSDALGRMGTDGAIVHAPSQRGRTFFVEPQGLVQGNNDLRQTMLAVTEEEQRILTELTARCTALEPELAKWQRALRDLDLLAAQLTMARRLDCHRPTVTSIERLPTDPAATLAEGDLIDLPQLRHPLLMLDGVEVVASDLCLRRGQALIISGPNAGGKTVSLKALGLSVLMMRAGFRVSADEGASLPCFRRIVTDVGDDQSLSANLSTFSAHLVHVRAALGHAAAAGPETLALFDEIAVGTDPEQGAALAEAILREMTQRNATCVVTTHYERLKVLAARDKGALAGRFANAAVGFDIEQMRPTFRLTLGVPGSSSAISVARRLGVDEGVLKLAEQLHGGRKRDMEALMVRLESERESLEQSRIELDEQRSRLDYEKSVLERRVARLERGAASKRQRAMESAIQSLHEYEEEIRRRRKKLRRSGINPDEVVSLEKNSGDLRAGINELRARATSPRKADVPAEPVPREWAVGDVVRIVSLDAEGEIVALKGRKLVVQLPHMRTTVAREAVARRSDEGGAAGGETQAGGARHDRGRASGGRPVRNTSAAARHFGDDCVPVVAGHDNSVALRGMTVEDAIEVVEPFLDTAILQQVDVVVLRHGHGSGELRKGLRRHLGRLRHVRQYRGGTSREGGDAVTVVWVDPQSV